MKVKNIFTISVLHLFVLSTVIGQNSNNCTRTQVALQVPSDLNCNEPPYLLVFEEDFSDLNFNLQRWKLVEAAQGNLQDPDASVQGYNTLDNVEVSNNSMKIWMDDNWVYEKVVSWKPDNEVMSDGFPNLRWQKFTMSNVWTDRRFPYGSV